MRPAPWMDTLTISVFSPFLQREVLISPAQYRLMVRVYSGWQGTQRALASLTGYTIGGVNDALQQLHRLGLVAIRVTRGRLGSTWARVRRGVVVIDRAVANVRERVEQLSILRRKRAKAPLRVANISTKARATWAITSVFDAVSRSTTAAKSSPSRLQPASKHSIR